MKTIIEQYMDVILQIIAEIAFFAFLGLCTARYQNVINGLFDEIMFR